MCFTRNYFNIIPKNGNQYWMFIDVIFNVLINKILKFKGGKVTSGTPIWSYNIKKQFYCNENFQEDCLQIFIILINVQETFGI